LAASFLLLGACYDDPPLEVEVHVQPDGSGTIALAFDGVREVEAAADETELQRLLSERTSGWRFPRDTSPYRILFFERFTVSRGPDGWRFDAWKYQNGRGPYSDGPLTLRLTLPGQITEHNADAEKDGVLTWNIWLDSTTVLYAVTTGNNERPGETPLWRTPPALLAAGAISAGLAVVAILVWRRRLR